MSEMKELRLEQIQAEAMKSIERAEKIQARLDGMFHNTSNATKMEWNRQAHQEIGYQKALLWMLQQINEG